jgi:hypothetical protein
MSAWHWPISFDTGPCSFPSVTLLSMTGGQHEGKQSSSEIIIQISVIIIQVWKHPTLENPNLLFLSTFTSWIFFNLYIQTKLRY